MPILQRRANPRVSFDTELWLGQDGVFTHTMSRMADVSVGGARILSPDAHQIGSILSLRFALQSSFITVTAIVRNVRPGSFGVEFLDLSPEDGLKLDSFVAAGERF